MMRLHNLICRDLSRMYLCTPHPPDGMYVLYRNKKWSIFANILIQSWGGMATRRIREEYEIGKQVNRGIYSEFVTSLSGPTAKPVAQLQHANIILEQTQCLKDRHIDPERLASCNVLPIFNFNLGLVPLPLFLFFRGYWILIQLHSIE